MTRSPGSSPESTSTKSGLRRPSRTWRRTALRPSAATTNTQLRRSPERRRRVSRARAGARASADLDGLAALQSPGSAHELEVDSNGRS